MRRPAMNALSSSAHPRKAHSPKYLEGARSRKLGLRRSPLALVLTVLSSRLPRWELEEFRRKILWPREHRIVTRWQFDKAPAGARHLAEHRVAALYDSLHLFKREAAQDAYLRQRFPGGVLQPQRLRKGSKRLGHGS